MNMTNKSALCDHVVARRVDKNLITLHVHKMAAHYAQRAIQSKSSLSSKEAAKSLAIDS